MLELTLPPNDHDPKVSEFQNVFWVSQIFQKSNEKFDKFLPQNLKSGQINKITALSYNTMIIWAN